MRACLLACILNTAAKVFPCFFRAVESLQKVVGEAGSSGSADALHLDLQSFR